MQYLYSYSKIPFILHTLHSVHVCIFAAETSAILGTYNRNVKLKWRVGSNKPLFDIETSVVAQGAASAARLARACSRTTSILGAPTGQRCSRIVEWGRLIFVQRWIANPLIFRRDLLHKRHHSRCVFGDKHSYLFHYNYISVTQRAPRAPWRDCTRMWSRRSYAENHILHFRNTI